MILVWGPPDDPPLNRVVSVLKGRGAEVFFLEDRNLGTLRYDVTIGVPPSGWIDLGGRVFQLDELTGVYLRPGDPGTGAALAVASTLLAMASTIPATVVNRPAAGRSNVCKPFQLGLIAAAGLAVPETLVTTDPQQAREFLGEHGRLVYKSISGIRSIVNTLDNNDQARLDGVRTGPVQLQRFVDGLDVRVHVVGRRWFGTAVESDVTDYRYASRDGVGVVMVPCDIPPDIGRRLVALTATMGLLVGGIDLRRTVDEQWYCFEVNPSPGFSYYEDATGQPIAEAIGDLLLSSARN